MTYTLPITCTQLCAIVLIVFFIAGNALLIPVEYSMKPFDIAFFGWLMTLASIVFGLVLFIAYVDDKNLIRCKCEK